MAISDAVQLLFSDWHRRRSETFLPKRPPGLAEYLKGRAEGGYEPAIRLLRAEELPPADVVPRQPNQRVSSGGPDVDLLEYAEDMLEQQWGEDCSHADVAAEIEMYWKIQNRLRRLLGLEQLSEEVLRDALSELT